jgi:hypothetical protein
MGREEGAGGVGVVVAGMVPPLRVTRAGFVRA